MAAQARAPRPRTSTDLRGRRVRAYQLGWTTKASEALGDQLDADETRALGFSLLEWLTTSNRRTVGPFVRGMLGGKDKLDEGVQYLFGATRDQFLQAWGRWVASKYGSRTLSRCPTSPARPRPRRLLHPGRLRHPPRPLPRRRPPRHRRPRPDALGRRPSSPAASSPSTPTPTSRWATSSPAASSSPSAATPGPSTPATSGGFPAASRTGSSPSTARPSPSTSSTRSARTTSATPAPAPTAGSSSRADAACWSCGAGG